MALDLPTSAKAVAQRIRVDVQRAMAGANTALEESWLGGFIRGVADRVFEFYYALARATLQVMPDTTIDFITRWASILGFSQLAATAASGDIVIQGLDAIVPVGTTFVTADGKEYVTTEAVTIATNTPSISGIASPVGGYSTVTTAAEHGLASNVLIKVSGADQSEYNKAAWTEMTVTGSTTLSYAVSGSPATATGTLVLTHESSPIAVISSETGESQNQVLDVELTVQTPITDLEDEANVGWGELGGGVDQEALSALRGRYLYRLRNPVAHFNVVEIETTAKTINGVTRVFVHETTPAVGQVSVFFMRDLDTDPIPSASEVAAVDAVLQVIRPANTDVNDLIVAAPVAVTTAITFSALNPNTAAMQAAITASLQQFFAERTDVGVDVDEDAYRSAIFNTVDILTGAEMGSFALSAPSGDVSVATGYIATLGTITYP